MKKILFVLIFFTFLSVTEGCRRKGCTDKQACNYDEDADKDDGSCNYGCNINGGGGSSSCFTGDPGCSAGWYTCSGTSTCYSTLSGCQADAACSGGGGGSSCYSGDAGCTPGLYICSATSTCYSTLSGCQDDPYCY